MSDVLNIPLTDFSKRCGASIVSYAYVANRALLSYRARCPVSDINFIGMAHLIEADMRFNIWDAALKSGNVDEVDCGTSDGTTTPLRFNEKFDFIEPYAEGDESFELAVTNSMVNQKWANAKYQVAVRVPAGLEVRYAMRSSTHADYPDHTLVEFHRKFPNHIECHCEYFERK